jgi:hypothetical protein
LKPVGWFVIIRYINKTKEVRVYLLSGGITGKSTSNPAGRIKYAIKRDSRIPFAVPKRLSKKNINSGQESSEI